jgi:Ca2+-binding EF-hand superfamily protein
MKCVVVAILLLALPVLAHAQAREAPALDEATAAFAAMDRDRDGQLSLREFEKGVARPFGSRERGVVYQRLPARFRGFDGNQDGFLEATEYAAFAQRWHGEGHAPALADVDQDGDGKVDFREFAILFVDRDDDGDGADPTVDAEQTGDSAPTGSGRMRSSHARPHAPISRTG